MINCTRIILISISLFLLLPSCSREGFTALSPEAYRQKLKEYDEKHIIDVRTSFEYKAGHIEHAKNIGYISFSFAEKADQLDRDKPVFLYCQTAHRSPLAAKKLRKMGFEEIYDLEGGFSAWQEEGFPVVE